MALMAGEFLDTNVLIYAFTDDPRNQKAQELLGKGCVIGVQVLNEFTNVARRKLGMTWEELREAPFLHPDRLPDCSAHGP